uniref:Uncharacterized protein n=1 Tax=Meloidogyne incognita TaxID=6306 RepID=A0A914KVF9_MELIC
MKSYKFDVELIAVRSTKAFTLDLVSGVDLGSFLRKQSEGEQTCEFTFWRFSLPGNFFTQLLCHAILVDALSVSRKPSFFPSAAFRFEPMHISIVDCYLVADIILPN